jgi:serine/threonine-protein kinase
VTAPQKTASKRPTGAKVGKYTLTQVLGQGGYGDVHLGVALAGQKVAVKILNAKASRDEDTVTRFKRESDTARRLEHPSIVRIVEVGSSRGRHYIVMELVRGGSLRRLLARPDAEPATVTSVLAEVAHALAFAHAQGVVHRDIKPENVLLTRAGRAKVADFGLARAVDQSSLTTEGRILGTASDVYAIGIMIYEAITGEPPFQADTQLGYLYQHAETAPPRPVIRRGYPAALGALALACLAKEAAARPTMAEVAARLDQAKKPRRRFVRLLWRVLRIALPVIVALSVVAIAVPSVLDPLCGDWALAAPFQLARRSARAAHDVVSRTIWPGPEPAKSRR